MKEEELHRRILEKYGIEFEALIAAEECGELIKELSKAVRYGRTHTGALPESYRLGIAEEMADVRIKIRQMIIAYGLNEADIREIEEKKLCRMGKLLEE